MYFAVFMMLILSAFLLGMTVGLKMYKSRFDELYVITQEQHKLWSKAFAEMNKDWFEFCSEIQNTNKALLQQLEEEYHKPGKSFAAWVESDIPGEKFVCSRCEGACWYYDYEGTVAKSRFCPNCGAYMREGEFDA